MTISLMRKNLCDITQNLQSTHAGLLMQRGLREWEEGEKPFKQALIGRISAVRPTDLYLLAFNRWLNATYDKENFATVSAKIDGRLFTGLPLGGTLETGATTHHTYGMPMIAGSSVKGAVRHYTEHLFAVRQDGQVQYQNGKVVIQENQQRILDILFGTDSDDDNADAGYLIWHDAWWIPEINSDGALSGGENNKPFVGEIVTVHHQKYYKGELTEALDIENPVLNQQIAICGSFYFVIEGESRWVEFAQMLLQDMLTEQGLGAKGSNGYGYFVLDDGKSIQPFLEYQKKQQELQEKLIEEEKKRAELAEATKNASALESEFLTEISEKNWRIFSSENQQSFTDRIEYWLSTLESNTDEKGCIDLMVEVAKIQYEKQMKKPDKAKPNQQVWIKRLLALKS